MIPNTCPILLVESHSSPASASGPLTNSFPMEEASKMAAVSLTAPHSRATASPTAALQTLSSRMAPDQFPGLKRSSPSMSDILADDSMNMEQKKMRLQSSMRMLKDEPVPEGYMRFR